MLQFIKNFLNQKEEKQKQEMTNIIFKNENELFVALVSEIIPKSQQTKPAKFSKTGGSIVVSINKDFTKSRLKKLEETGIKKTQRVGKTPVSCWAEILSPRQIGEKDLNLKFVLFLLDDDSNLVSLASELLRLGCDRQSYSVQKINNKKRIILRAAEPPYYTVASSFDESRNFKSFIPVRHGQESVYCEFGYSHPLSKELNAGEGEILLIEKDGSWISVENGPWQDIYQLIDFNAPKIKDPHTTTEPEKRLKVFLKFTNAVRNEKTLFWVLRENAIGVMDQMVQTLPNDVLSKFLFAIMGDKENPIVVLKSRTNNPPEIDIDGEQYVPFLKISNLFIPKDKIIEPPLRRDKIRELLAPNDENIGWLTPTQNGYFSVENVPEASFSPLIDWVDYIIKGGENEIEPWLRSSIFEFSSYVSTGAEWTDKPKEEKKTKKKKNLFSFAPFKKEEKEEKEEKVETKNDNNFVIEENEEVEESTPPEIQYEGLKEQFLSINAPLDSASRVGIWAEMGKLNKEMGKNNDAHICWAYAVNSSNGIVAVNYCREWLRLHFENDKTEEFMENVLKSKLFSRTNFQKMSTILISHYLVGNPKLNGQSLKKLKEFVEKNQELLSIQEQEILSSKAQMKFKRTETNLDLDVPFFLYHHTDKISLA